MAIIASWLTFTIIRIPGADLCQALSWVLGLQGHGPCPERSTRPTWLTFLLQTSDSSL